MMLSLYDLFLILAGTATTAVSTTLLNSSTPSALGAITSCYNNN